MNDLIKLILAHFESDEGPELFGEFGSELDEEGKIELAQSIAGAIVEAGWPRAEA